MATLDHFRELAMRLPRVEELDHFGMRSFRMRGESPRVTPKKMHGELHVGT